METSLRSRPSKAPRKAQRTPTKLSKGGPTQRDRGKNRVDDKIKKRMSTRYADISSPTEVTGVPPMPAMMDFIPAGGAGVTASRGGDEEVRDRSDTREEARAAVDDRKLLSAEDFDPAAFLKVKLANSTEAELKSLESSLRGASQDTSSELQRSVFKNYAEFVLISKEISVLENEMLELKELLSDYKSMPSTLQIPDPTSAPSSTLSTYKRSSIADLRVLYFNQMQNLHASIEGASKFVPTTPGRHVVSEMEGVYGLNAATYKITGRVKFVILDDAVLVAKRRRRNAGTSAPDGSSSTVNEGKLVAERCWPLSEMLVLDTKDSPSITNVFKIRHGKETHVYRTESPTDKKALLSQFRQVAEELSQKKRKEREGEHERRKSMWQGGSGGSGSVPDMPAIPDWMADLARKGGEIPGMGTNAKEKSERDARWVGEWSDDLAIAIALKEWAKAVELVEQGQAKVAVTPLLASKLPQLTSQLISSLLDTLSFPSNRKSTVISLITLLNRLKAGAAARNAFLEMRTKVISGHARKIRFDGHIGTYVGELAVVYFTGIKHTADWYLASFKENEVASAFITWTKDRLEDYATIFRKQVYSKDVDRKVVEDATQVTQTQSRKLLQEYGLDFRYLLDDVLLENPKKPLEPAPALSLSEHRVSRAGPSIQPLSIKKPERPPRQSTSTAQNQDRNAQTLAPAPPPPTISAAPSRRKRSPAPTALAATNTTPFPDEVSYLGGSRQPSELLSPGPRGGPNGILSPTTPQSAYSSRPPPSAMRSRTPVRPEQATTPTSAPMPPAGLASPLPRPPMSATPLRMRSDSYSSTAESYRSGGGYDSAREGGSVRERPPRSARGSPVPRSPIPPPPRSANRPGSSVGQKTPIAVAQHDGMI